MLESITEVRGYVNKQLTTKQEIADE